MTRKTIRIATCCPAMAVLNEHMHLKMSQLATECLDTISERALGFRSRNLQCSDLYKDMNDAFLVLCPRLLHTSPNNLVGGSGMRVFQFEFGAIV